MSESDRLRAMLDELGVEYRTDDASYTFATHWTDSLGRGCSFVEEVYDGESKTIFVSEPSARNITPEQAIAATLGSEREKALEELVRDMYRCIAHANEQDWFHFEKDVSGCGLSCTVNGENCGLASLANRMRELGVTL